MYWTGQGHNGIVGKLLAEECGQGTKARVLVVLAGVGLPPKTRISNRNRCHAEKEQKNLPTDGTKATFANFLDGTTSSVLPHQPSSPRCFGLLALLVPVFQPSL